MKDKTNPGKEYIKLVFKTLKNRVPTNSWLELVKKYSPGPKGFKDFEEERKARHSLFEEALIMNTVSTSNFKNEVMDNVTATDLEYFCHLTGFLDYIPKIYTWQVVRPENSYKREALFQTVKCLRIAAELARKEPPPQKEEEAPKAKGFSNEDIQKGVSQSLSVIPRADEASKDPAVKATESSQKEQDIQIEAELRADIASLDPVSPFKQAMSKSRVKRIIDEVVEEGEEAKEESDTASETSDKVPDQPEFPANMGCQETDPVKEMLGTVKALGIPIEEYDSVDADDEESSSQIKGYTNKPTTNPNQRENPVPYSKTLYESQALSDVANELRSKTATPDADAPSNNASGLGQYKVMAYSISDEDMRILYKSKEEITQEESRLISKWLQDGLTHATSVPEDLTLSALLRHISEDLTPNQLAVVITRVKASLAMLDLKRRVLEEDDDTCGPNDEEVWAGQTLSDAVAIDSLVTCVGPVIDYLHASLEEMRANNEAPRKDLEQLFRRTCAKLENHAGSFEHLTTQVNTLIEKTTNMSMDDLGKNMVSASINRKSTMSVLSSASGYDTPRTDVVESSDHPDVPKATAKRTGSESMRAHNDRLRELMSKMDA